MDARVIGPNVSSAIQAVGENSVLSQLEADGFCEVPWDAAWTTRLAGQAKEGFWRMLASPERELFKWRHATEQNDNGLFERKGELKTDLTALEIAEGRQHYDSKFFFHYREGVEDLLKKQGAPVEQYGLFFDALNGFNAASRRIALAVATLYDDINEARAKSKRYPGSFRDKVIRGDAVTRLLRYPHKKAGGVLANLHRDRCAITSHWVSSDAGLILYRPNKQPVQARDTDPNVVSVFPGEKAWVAMRGTFGTGTPHGASTKSNGNTEDRFVAVSFIHCALNRRDLEWRERHKDELTMNPADYPL